jgi:hypothetical protein
VGEEGGVSAERQHEANQVRARITEGAAGIFGRGQSGQRD